MRDEWFRRSDVWTAHELIHNSLDDQTCRNPKNEYSVHIRHYQYSQVRKKREMHGIMMYQSKSERRKKRWITKLSLYQGCHYANDRQGIERREGDEYDTSACIKVVTGEWTRLVFGLRHDGIEGRVTKGGIIVHFTLKKFYTLAVSTARTTWQFWDPIWTTAVYKGCHSRFELCLTKR